MAGGIFVRSDGHLDPRRLTAALAPLVTSRGGTIRTGVPVRDFAVRDGRVTAVQADTGRDGPDGLAADSVVIAAGALSVPVTRLLGARLPMTAGKGYSVSVACPELPEAPMYLVESRVGATPLAGRLRLAGTIEFSGLNSRLDRRRITSLTRAARAYFPALTGPTSPRNGPGCGRCARTGCRSLTGCPAPPTPIVATGHSTLGITLAAVTGAHMAEFVSTGTPPSAAAPFRFPSYARRPRYDGRPEGVPTMSRQLTIDDLLAVRQPAEADISPDGASIAVVVADGYGAQGRSPAVRLWLGPLGGDLRQITDADCVDGVPRWSPDGRELAFGSDRDHSGRMSLYLAEAGSGAVSPLAEPAGSIEEIAWAPDGGSVLVLAADLGLDTAGSLNAVTIAAADTLPPDPVVVSGPPGLRRLWQVDRATGAISELDLGGRNVWDFSWDGPHPGRHRVG